MKSRLLDSIFFETVANEAMMGIAAFSLPDRKCVYINMLCRETLEIPANYDIASEDLFLNLLFPSESRGNFRALSDETLANEGFLNDMLVQRFNSTTFIANVGLKYLDIANGQRVILLMLQDITFQKKLQREIQLKQEAVQSAYQELLQQNDQLKALDKAKDRFIALTTHELRTPLAAIVATADVLVMKLYDTEEQKEDFIKTVHEQGMHLMDLVNDVLDFAKLQAGKMDYYIEHSPINAILDNAKEVYESMAEKSKVQLQFSPAPEGHLCYFDILRMKEILNNVVSNAIKYNRSGGFVRISVELSEPFTRIVVEDSGMGIPEDKLSSVFNEFETVGAVAKHHKGTGLGMPISRRMIEDMGGKIDLQSTVGVGTKFFIDIPNQKVLAEDNYRARPDSSYDLIA